MHVVDGGIDVGMSSRMNRVGRVCGGKNGMLWYILLGINAKRYEKVVPNELYRAETWNIGISDTDNLECSTEMKVSRCTLMRPLPGGDIQPVRRGTLLKRQLSPLATYQAIGFVCKHETLVFQSSSLYLADLDTQSCAFSCQSWQHCLSGSRFQFLTGSGRGEWRPVSRAVVHPYIYSLT